MNRGTAKAPRSAKDAKLKEGSTTNASTDLREIAVERLVPTPDNPRVMREDKAFGELVESVRSLGILQPLIARPISGEEAVVALSSVDWPKPTKAAHDRGEDIYDLRAGHRRLMAAAKAGLVTVPVIVREMNDQTAMEITVSENLQRENLHPLEESAAIQRLLDVGWDTAAIADRLGKPASWVARRARLRDLSDAWLKAIADPEEVYSLWPAALLDRIARLPADMQDMVLVDDCLDRGEKEPLPTVADIDRVIAVEYLGTLAGAPWKLDDETLVPEVGSCSACEKRSSFQPLLFEGLEDAAAKGKKKPVSKDRCLDSKCYDRKLQAHVRRRAAVLKAKHPNLAFIAHAGCGWNEEKALAKEWGGLMNSYSVPCKKSDARAVPVMIVSGPAVGTLKWVSKPSRAAGGKAPAAASVAADGPTPLAERRKKLEARRRANVISAILEKIEADDYELPLTDLVEVAALATAFGTRHKWDYAGHAYGIQGGRSREIDVWGVFDAMRSGGQDALALGLGNAVIPVIAARIRVHDMRQVAEAWPEAKHVCELLGIDIGALRAAAVAAIPNPKSWANLKADGTPKARKATAKPPRRKGAKGKAKE